MESWKERPSPTSIRVHAKSVNCTPITSATTQAVTAITSTVHRRSTISYLFVMWIAIVIPTIRMIQKASEAADSGAPSTGSAAEKANAAAASTPPWPMMPWVKFSRPRYDIQLLPKIRGETSLYPVTDGLPVEIDQRASSICTPTLTSVDKRMIHSRTKPTCAPSAVAVISSPEPTTAALVTMPGPRKRSEGRQPRGGCRILLVLRT